MTFAENDSGDGGCGASTVMNVGRLGEWERRGGHVRGGVKVGQVS